MNFHDYCGRACCTDTGVCRKHSIVILFSCIYASKSVIVHKQYVIMPGVLRLLVVTSQNVNHIPRKFIYILPPLSVPQKQSEYHETRFLRIEKAFLAFHMKTNDNDIIVYIFLFQN